MELLGVEELKPYENNARKHESVDVEAIKKSIKEFGFNDPIGIWKDNIIIEGHGRLLAAKELKVDRVPVIRLNELTDEQRRAYTLAHNKTAELSSWDFEKLEAELEAIDIDMSDFGFEDTSIYSENDLNSVLSWCSFSAIVFTNSSKLYFLCLYKSVIYLSPIFNEIDPVELVELNLLEDLKKIIISKNILIRGDIKWQKDVMKSG